MHQRWVQVIAVMGLTVVNTTPAVGEHRNTARLSAMPRAPQARVAPSEFDYKIFASFVDSGRLLGMARYGAPPCTGAPGVAADARSNPLSAC